MTPKTTASAAPQCARAVPFASTQEAWFWTMAALVARRDGAGLAMGAAQAHRPCEPDDVVKCLDRLYRQRRIDLAHARVLRIWGERQQAPEQRQDPGANRLWREALLLLEWPLRVKGIVGTGPFDVAGLGQVLPAMPEAPR